MRYNPLNLIPEGRIKSALRKIYRAYVRPLPFKEIQKDGLYEYHFKNGVVLRFAQREFLDVSSPLRGYLKHHSPKRGDIVIDAGAFHGVYALYASKLVGKEGKVFVFEPHPDNCKVIKKNIQLNNVKNITIIQKGLWDKKDTLQLSDDTSLSSFVLKENRSPPKISVPVISIDTFVKEKRLTRLDFIKMDIEGAEIQALMGAKESMKTLRPEMAIASYHVIQGEKTYKWLEKYLQKFGYRSFTGSPHHLTTYALRQ